MKGYRLQNKDGLGPMSYIKNCIENESISDEELNRIDAIIYNNTVECGFDISNAMLHSGDVTYKEMCVKHMKEGNKFVCKDEQQLYKYFPKEFIEYFIKNHGFEIVEIEGELVYENEVEIVLKVNV